MADTTVSMPVFKVKLAGKRQLTVKVPNGVQVQWELERVRKSLPVTGDAPTVWASWVCWAAAKRAGQVESDMPWEAWNDSLEMLQFSENEAANPPKQAPAGG